MDLMSEATGGSRVLTTRHVNIENKLPEKNNAINTTLVCDSYDPQPDFYSYLTVLHPYAWVMWSGELLAVFVMCLLYGITLRHALRNWRESHLSVALVLSVYPIVAALSLIVTIVPRTRILCEAFSQQIVMIALYHFLNLIIAECGGASQFISRSAGSLLETRVLPCCCWPCCILPRPQVNKKSLSFLRYLVLQVPIIQGILFFIILALRAEGMNLYKHCLVYIQPFVAASILSGVWGIIMCIRAAVGVGCNPRPRFLVLQLALIIVKLQYGIAKSLPDLFDMPCVMALHPSVFVNLIQNVLTVVEMLFLSICAWRLYLIPPGKNMNRIQQVVVTALEDSINSNDKDIESIKNSD